MCTISITMSTRKIDNTSNVGSSNRRNTMFLKVFLLSCVENFRWYFQDNFSCELTGGHLGNLPNWFNTICHVRVSRLQILDSGTDWQRQHYLLGYMLAAPFRGLWLSWMAPTLVNCIRDLLSEEAWRISHKVAVSWYLPLGIFTFYTFVSTA